MDEDPWFIKIAEIDPEEEDPIELLGLLAEGGFQEVRREVNEEGVWVIETSADDFVKALRVVRRYRGVDLSRHSSGRGYAQGL